VHPIYRYLSAVGVIFLTRSEELQRGLKYRQRPSSRANDLELDITTRREASAPRGEDGTEPFNDCR
jgi:hypothetical protein